MITHHKIEGYENFQKLMKFLDGKGKVFLFFHGSHNPEGNSWCSDCVEAEPLVEKVLQANENKDFHFVHVGVGTRSEWKDPKCPFRVDGNLKLTSVPTLLQWKSPHRLNDSECKIEDNLNLMFEEVNG